jgi:integrase
MSIYYDKAKGQWRYSLNKIIKGERIRATKLLPKAWGQAEALSFDVAETARIVAEATGVKKPERTIEEAVRIYMEEKVPELKAKRDYIREFANMYYMYAGKPISALPEVCREIAQLTKPAAEGKGKNRRIVQVPLANATKRNKIRYLSAACTYAFKYHDFCDNNPAEKVRLPKVRNNRNSAPTRLEMLQIAKHMPRGVCRSAVIVAFYTGMRQSEILRGDVTREMFLAKDTKNGTDKHTPINPRILVHLKHFPSDIEQMKFINEWKKARRKAGLKHYRFHDLRHSAASEMISSGVSLSIVGEVLGHKSPQSTKRYAHLAAKERLAALMTIGRKR